MGEGTLWSFPESKRSRLAGSAGGGIYVEDLCIALQIEPDGGGEYTGHSCRERVAFS